VGQACDGQLRLDRRSAQRAVRAGPSPAFRSRRAWGRRAPEEAPHRVEIRGPLDRGAHGEAYPTPDEARTAYERIIAGDPVTPLRTSGVWKVQLVLDGATVEERLVVRTLPWAV
jgi:hypothetical protein